MNSGESGNLWSGACSPPFCWQQQWPGAASQHLGDTGRQAGYTTLEPASQHLAPDRRDWETQGDKRETSPEPASQHLASDRGDTGTSTIWHLTAETGRHRETSAPKGHLRSTGRQAGYTTLEPASQYLASQTSPEPTSQHLASDRGDWETQGDKQETQPQSRRHSIWDRTAETGESGI